MSEYDPLTLVMRDKERFDYFFRCNNCKTPMILQWYSTSTGAPLDVMLKYGEENPSAIFEGLLFELTCPQCQFNYVCAIGFSESKQAILAVRSFDFEPAPLALINRI